MQLDVVGVPVAVNVKRPDSFAVDGKEASLEVEAEVSRSRLPWYPTKKKPCFIFQR